MTCIAQKTGQYSVLRLSTGWMVQGIKSWWGQDFLHSSRMAVGIAQLPVQWISCLFPGGKGAGSWPLSSIPPTVDGKERVELYLYPIWVFMACYRMNFTFTFTFHIVWYSIVFIVMVHYYSIYTLQLCNNTHQYAKKTAKIKYSKAWRTHVHTDIHTSAECCTQHRNCSSITHTLQKDLWYKKWLILTVLIIYRAQTICKQGKCYNCYILPAQFFPWQQVCHEVVLPFWKFISLD